MRKSFVVILALIFVINTKGQNIGIGTNTPDSSAVLELSSSNKGFLPPRITTSQRNAITHPAEGLQIFNTTTHCLEMYVYGRWQNVFCGVPDTTNNVDTTLLTDIDGQTYPTVKICNQTWMAKNLDVARYRNGDIIPQVTDPTQWANLTTGAWCWYNNDSANGSIYGRLYNWYAVNDPRGLAPEGWHVASDKDWNNLVKCLDPNADTTNIDWTNTQAGGMLKSSNGWNGNNNGSNSSGFNGLPGGGRYDNGFWFLGGGGYWWSNTETNSLTSWLHGLNIFNYYLFRGSLSKNFGFSVRCIKDTPITTLNNGLVAYYPFNGNANDESGNGNNGTVNGATLTTDRFGNSGKAYSFDGSSNYINVPFSQSLNSIQNGMSISAWVLMDGGTGSGTPPRVLELRGAYGGGGDAGIVMLAQSNSNSSRTFEVRWHNDFGNNNISISPTSAVASLNWHHLVFAADGNTGYGAFYVDGNLINTNSSMPGQGLISTCNYNNNPLIIGAEPNLLGKWGGKLDDIRIYNRALTQEEISYLAGH